MTLFDNFSILDPQRELNQVVDALGTNPFDAFSLLDPTRYQEQIEAVALTSIFTRFSDDTALAEKQITAAIGGGFVHLAHATLAATAGSGSTARQRMQGRMTAVAAAGELTAAAQRMAMIESAVASAGRTGV